MAVVKPRCWHVQHVTETLVEEYAKVQTGSTTVGYQGCPYSNTGGNYPQPGKNELMVCPEDNGQPTQSGDAVSCGGSTVDIGIRDAKTYISGGPW